MNIWQSRNIYRKGLILISLCLLIPGPVSAQQKAYGIPQTDYFSRRTYNAASQNWDITQSENDFLYFANNEGVLEYDGAVWKIHKNMGSYVVRSVKSIGDRIYAGTFGEIGYFSYENNLGLKYTSLTFTEEIKSYGDYWTIHEWNDKIVFHSQQALCFFTGDSLLEIISAPSRFTGSFLVNGMLLVNDEKEGLMEVRGKHVYPLAGGGILKDKLITTIMPASENMIVIGTMKEGLYTWDMQNIRKWNADANDVLEQANIYCGVRYENKYFVFGTIQSGMVISDLSGKIIFQIGKDKGLNNNTVLSLFVDRDGNVWGGLDNGIVKINLRSSITFLQGYYDLGTGYVADRPGERWYLGTNQGLFAISEGSFSNPVKNRDHFIKVPGTDGQVWNLFETENALLCGHNMGVFEINKTGARLLTPSSVNGAWIFRKVPGKENLLIVGTYDGLVLLEKTSDGWNYKSKIEGFGESSRYMEWSGNGEIGRAHV